jgi:CheY-like chemotaxis protein
LQSRPGKGTTFSVRLYLREIENPGPMIESPHQIVGYFGKRQTLLVVDDQPVQRQMLAGMLAPYGFDVKEAASGTECIESLNEDLPDAILLDITMDDMDGWQTARQIREKGCTVPIIMVSANVFENQHGCLKAHGCQGFVGKPVLESELMDALQRCIGLNWVTANAAPVIASVAPTSEILKLSDDAREELIRLVQLGHIHGLHRLLDRLASEDPNLTNCCAQLRVFVSQYDLETLLDHLTKNEDAVEP